MDRIWITWERQRRNRTLSQALGAELFEFADFPRGIRRYIGASVRTIQTIIRECPRVVFVQNPSFVLVLVATVICRVSNRTLIVDAHNAALFPFEGRWRWTNSIAALFFRMADLTIVTNRTLADYVSRRGGVAVVLPDPMPEFSPSSVSKQTLKGRYNVLFICTWAVDERYEEVIEAARILGPDFMLYITGNDRGRSQRLTKKLPSNVVLTGYLDDASYVEMLYSCDVIIDITDRENCLVCGAYEALAAGTPLIVSGSDALKDYFSKGVLFTNNSSVDIAEKVVVAIASGSTLRVQMQALRAELKQRWLEQQAHFEEALSVLPGK